MVGIADHPISWCNCNTDGRDTMGKLAVLEALTIKVRRYEPENWWIYVYGFKRQQNGNWSKLIYQIIGEEHAGTRALAPSHLYSINEYGITWIWTVFFFNLVHPSFISIYYIIQGGPCSYTFINPIHRYSIYQHISTILPYTIVSQWEFQDPKIEVPYYIFGIFFVWDIPLHRPKN